MFAVKGWSVDAKTLKRQVAPFTQPAESNGDGNPKPQKKRKRAGNAALPAGDVGKLWDQHIEKKEVVEKKPSAESTNKRQKLQAGGADAPAPPAVASEKTESAQNVKKHKDEHNGKTEEPKKAKKKEKEGKRKSIDAPKGEDSNNEPTSSVAGVPAPPSSMSKLTPMQAAMRQKLISARFRHLNQTLYTEPSAKALELFDQNPEMFEDYHSGFRQQVTTWPENPVDSFISTIRTRGAVRLLSQKKFFREKSKSKKSEAPEVPFDRSTPALPRTQGACIIADLGCGDARLAQTLKESGEMVKLNLKIQSYDLLSVSPFVTKADISNIPTADGTVDVAIFCLALMGTNWISFIEEAYRILHWKGELWIAEIKSRFGRVGKAGKPVDHSVGGKRKLAALKKAQDAKKREQDEVDDQTALQVEVDGVATKNEETDVSQFVEVLGRRGFVLKNDQSSIDLSNRMFVRMEFIKAATPTKGKGVPAQQPQNPPKFRTKAKFLDAPDENVASEDEAKTLKPCLYKIR